MTYCVISFKACLKLPACTVLNLIRASALNRLYSDASLRKAAKATNAQHNVHIMMWRQSERMVRRLHACGNLPCGKEALDSFIRQEAKMSAGGLRAADFDIVTPPAPVDPVRFLPRDVKESMRPSVLFHSSPSSLERPPSVREKD